MTSSGDTKIILIKRSTRLDDLIIRYNTISQAKFYIEHLNADFNDYLDEHKKYYQLENNINDLNLLKQISHEMKGVFGNLGITELYELSTEIEEICNNSESYDEHRIVAIIEKLKNIQTYLSTLDKKIKLKENIKTILYSNKDYGFNIVTNKGCEKYLKATNSYVGGTMTGGDVVRSVEVTLPLAKQKGGVWLNYQLASQVEFNKIVESSQELPGSPRIILNLDNNMVLFMTGIIQSTEMPPLTDLPANCDVKAEKI